MIRDRGPIHSLGNGLTSRDVPSEEGEIEGMSPDSGIFARAIGGHPVMRFFAHTGTSLLVAGVLAASVRSGGLRLTKTLQSRADAGSPFSTRAVKSITDIRRQLDELQGVSRHIDGVDDVYSKLVFERSGKLTTGYDPRVRQKAGYNFLTQDEINEAALGFMSEPTAVWSWRDQLQQNLVRAGRRLPYELPALYAAQRGVTDTLFGENSNSKVNWYNPVDVVADFTRQSVFNLGTAILPFEFAGAGIRHTKNSLHSLRYTYNDINTLTGGKKLIANNLPNIEGLLNEVGHDFASVTDKVLKKSAQSSGALSAASEVFSNRLGFNQAYLSLETSFKDQYREALRSSPRSKAAFQAASKVFFPNRDDTSIFDLFPGFRGVTKAFQEGKKEFNLIGQGYDAHKSALAFNETLHKLSTTSPSSADRLKDAVSKVQSMHNSRLSRVADSLHTLGRGGPEGGAFNRSDFFRGQMQREAKRVLSSELNSRLAGQGVSSSDITGFVKMLDINLGKGSASHSSNVATIGKSRILSADEQNPADYFNQILQRYRQDQTGQELFSKITGRSGQAGNVLEESIEAAKQVFASKSYRDALESKIAGQWNSMLDDLASGGAAFLKTKKGQYQDFIGPLTTAKKSFLERKSAELLGIPLVGEHGRSVADSMLRSKLATRGFDPQSNLYYQDLRAFLIQNKQIDSGVFSGGFNLFGLKSVTVDEARRDGFFQFMPEDRQSAIYKLAGRMSTNDPVSKSLNNNVLDGVYKTRSGQTIDVSAIKSNFAAVGDFFASEFRIPILGFNPADLFGYRSFKEMAARGPLQYTPGMTVQPFRGLSADKSDFYIWQSTGGFRGTKGRVTAYSTNESTQVFGGTMLEGTYRPVPTKSSDMLTRVARFAAGFRGATIDEISTDLAAGETGRNRFLTKVLGNEQNAIRFKKALNIDSEQPNSFFNLAERFINRKHDINNPIVLQKLLRGETVSYSAKGKAKTMTMQTTADGKLQVVDELGEAVSGYGEEQIIRAYHTMRGQIGNSFFSKQVIKSLEEADPSTFGLTLGSSGRRSLGDLAGARSLEEIAEEIVANRSLRLSEIRARGMDPAAVGGSIANIERELFSAGQSTIVGRQEKLRNLIFQYAIQNNVASDIAAPGAEFGQKFIKMNQLLDDLLSKGAISKSQATEARAAGLYTFLNINAFSTYKPGVSSLANERSTIRNLAEGMQANPEARSLLNVIGSGEMASSTGPVRSKFSFLMPTLKRKFGTAPYQPDPISLDPLGTGQSTTFVPTFGTVFGQDRFGAIKSAIGLTTYSDPENYSSAGVPIAHGIERLNRYFGTLGMQLDVNSHSGPLGLFAGGMVGRRVLPMYAAGLGFMTLDRTAGGLVEGVDERGERIYSPLILGTLGRGVVEAQAIGAGLMPGGMGYQEKREQLLEGEVPIRRGRFWPLSSTPFMGEEIMYYSPSWYRRMQGAASYTSESLGSPIENFLFYTDISPLRPLDPYRFERKHYETRPYPVTGDYFTGPFGPLVPLGNMTIGRLLKPRVSMHEEDVQAGLAMYGAAGQAGAYSAAGYIQPRGQLQAGVAGGVGSPSEQAMQIAPQSASNMMIGRQIGGLNSQMALASAPLNTASNLTVSSISSFNYNYRDLAYGAPVQRGVMTPNIVPTGEPVGSSSLNFLAGELAFRSQEMLGIYGFGAATLRETLGFGTADLSPQRGVLQSASAGYSSTRSFWDLHLGGLGDVPLSVRGPLGNIEFSEIVRRFIPKERSDVEQINPIPNTMGALYPFLPGADYFTDFTRGDPFTKVPRGEIRLPGVGYERMNRLYSDEYGRYGLLDQYNILADVAPYSNEFRSLDQNIDMMMTEPDQKIQLQKIREKLQNTTRRYDFAEYKYKGVPAEDLGMRPTLAGASRIGELIAHSDNFLIQKFGGKNTATEHWERNNVYGASFPQWQNPMESYIEPLFYKATQRNPISAMATLSVVGAAFGRTPRATFGGGVLGGALGGLASAGASAQEMITGQRYIPMREKQRLALEEYVDILSYVKSNRLATMAEVSGDAYSANMYRREAARTMYGADLESGDISSLILAIPKRKRDHFTAMLDAPVQDRERILSTAGRLERRIFQAAWGMRVEEKPDLVEYFGRHELPDTSWEGWHPNTSMEAVKIKMGQSMGIEMSQMGYYPQQIREANLVNPSYPQFGGGMGRQTVTQRLQSLMAGSGVTGTIRPVYNSFGNDSMQLRAGIM